MKSRLLVKSGVRVSKMDDNNVSELAFPEPEVDVYAGCTDTPLGDISTVHSGSSRHPFSSLSEKFHSPGCTGNRCVVF